MRNPADGAQLSRSLNKLSYPGIEQNELLKRLDSALPP
jgi:hypothetical protein